jgi:hypothetical protein
VSKCKTVLQDKVANTEILVCTNRTCRKDGSLQVRGCMPIKELLSVQGCGDSFSVCMKHVQRVVL